MWKGARLEAADLGLVAGQARGRRGRAQVGQHDAPVLAAGGQRVPPPGQRAHAPAVPPELPRQLLLRATSTSGGCLDRV